MPRRAILIVASASALLAPQSTIKQTRRHSTTLNPLEQLAEQAQIKAYEASAAAIAATISAKVAEKGDRMPDGMVPIVQEFMRTYLDVVAKQKRDPMEKVPTPRPVVWRRLHFFNTTRVHLTMKWVVSFSSLSPLSAGTSTEGVLRISGRPARRAFCVCAVPRGVDGGK